MTPPAPAASTLWANLETLVAARVPRGWAQTLLGVWGGFGAYGRELEEFTWPGPAASAALSQRAGLRLTVGHDMEGLHRRLADGGWAVAAVDAFHLPYRPAFQRVHAARTVLVRRGHAPETVQVDDRWPPAWSGEIATADLDRARASANPAEPEREPLFSGTPVGCRWWAAPDTPHPPRDADRWLAARLCDLHADVATGGAAAAFAGLAERLGPGGATGAQCRRASLILRAEISARLYRAHLLALAGARLGDAWLQVEATRQGHVLQRLGLARDILAKAVVLPRPLYFRIAAAALAEAQAGEHALQEALAAYAAPARPADRDVAVA